MQFATITTLQISQRIRNAYEYASYYLYQGYRGYPYSYAYAL